MHQKPAHEMVPCSLCVCCVLVWAASFTACEAYLVTERVPPLQSFCVPVEGFLFKKIKKSIDLVLIHFGISLRRAVLQGLNLWKFVLGISLSSVCFICIWIDLVDLTWQRVYIWKEFWNVRLLMTEFDCPEVTGWQDDKIQLLILGSGSQNLNFTTAI